jgi:CBASS immunity sensor of nucleotide second messenger signals
MQPSESEPRVDPFGPIFICHRTSDGAHLSRQLSIALRACGVPVWHSHDNLDPGEVEGRLASAIRGGLSGGVIVVTSEIGESGVVRTIELPMLLELSRDPNFVLAVANTFQDPEGQMDLGAPARILGLNRTRLSLLKQHPLFSEADYYELAKAIALYRMSVFRRLGLAQLVIDLDTRAQHPSAWPRGGHLFVRVPAQTSTRRTPPPAAWTAFGHFIELLPSLVTESGAQEVLVTGTGHLSAAAALGAVLPTTSRWAVGVRQIDVLWHDRPGQQAVHLDVATEARSGSGQVAAMVDVARGPGFSTFSDFIAKSEREFAASVIVTSGGHTLTPDVAAATADRVADAIREVAVTNQTTAVALFLRAPFPVALMLGRRLNTLDVTLFEWEGGSSPHYVPVITVSSGLGSPVLTIPDPDDHHMEVEIGNAGF